MALGWLWWRAWSAMAPWRRGLLCGRRGTSWHLPSLSVAGVALRDIYRRFVWQAWHLMTWIVTLRGRRGTYGTGLALVARLVSHGSWRCSYVCYPSVLLKLTVFVTAAVFCCSARHRLRRADAAVQYMHTYIHCITLHYMTWHDMTLHYIHTYITCIHTLHTYIHAYIHTYIHTSMHAQLTHTGLYVDVIAKELALSEATWCYWISVFSIVCLAGLLFGCKSFTWLHTPILHHLFSLSCFPHAIFTFLLLLVGRSWHVGLSGPLIFRRKTYPISAAVGHGQPWTAAHLAPVVSASTCPQAFNHCAPINCATCWAAVAIFKPYLSSLGLAMATGPSLYFNHFSPWFFGEGSGFHMQCVLWT